MNVAKIFAPLMMPSQFFLRDLPRPPASLCLEWCGGNGSFDPDDDLRICRDLEPRAFIRSMDFLY